MIRSLIAATIGLVFLIPATALAQTFEQIARARMICGQFGFQPRTESFASCVREISLKLEVEDRYRGGEEPRAELGIFDNAALLAAIKGISIAEAKQQLRKARGSPY